MVVGTGAYLRPRVHPAKDVDRVASATRQDFAEAVAAVACTDGHEGVAPGSEDSSKLDPLRVSGTQTLTSWRSPQPGVFVAAV